MNCLRGLCVTCWVLVFGGVTSAQQPDSVYRVVDTGQGRCYDNRSEIRFPSSREPFYGQDAQYDGNTPAYRDNGDGTIADLNTGLVWQKTPDSDTRSWEDAKEYAQSLSLAGCEDWRLPTIKELFSIADFRGNMHTRTPYIDTEYFDFIYPDPSAGVRDMDAQYWSSTRYVGTTMRGDQSVFGFNFADGRIKSYPIAFGGSPARRGPSRGVRKYVRCVRGPAYGINRFVDNGDGTITDRATGLMWMKADSGTAMNWQEALRHAEDLEYASHDDWRLPNVKELQTIVDYSRAPDARNPSVRGAAIDPIFQVTEMESWFWTSTTHIENQFGYYVCFGQAFSAREWNEKRMNAHGAGAVRSDPKSGDPSRWAGGHGPQADEIRIYNYVRCVRGGKAKLRMAPRVDSRSSTAEQPPRPSVPSHTTGSRFVERLDANKDGKVSQAEFDGPLHHFRTLDRDGDGFLSEDEAPEGPPPGHKPPRKKPKPISTRPR